MTLRARLTILYTILMVGILLLFGVAVSLFFNDRVRSQLDQELASAATLVIENIRVDPFGTLVVADQILTSELPANLYVLVIGHSINEIYYSNLPFRPPLDPIGLRTLNTTVRDAQVGNLPLRVRTVPLAVSDRQVGTLQVGLSRDLVVDTQRILFSLTVAGMLIGSVVAALAVWLSTRQALAALSHATASALTITRADDLSHRIPYGGPADDEIGQLISAFNQTLSRLERLFTTQRRFVADVGHELRTPLTVIKGNANLMRRMGCGDEESLLGIEDEVDRLTRLVGDLLLLAQAESGKLILGRDAVELDSLVLDAMSQLRVLIQPGQHLRLEDVDQVLVIGDRDKLKQVLLNLISNAIKYAPGGEVIISLQKTETHASIRIRDTGPGIPPEDLPFIFERFYRADKSRSRSHGPKGFGLGLSIAYWIVHNHGGWIDVDSQIGQGTTFTVWLPLTEKDRRQPDSEQPA